MYRFGNKSASQLSTCHKDIQIILNEAIKIYDFSVLEGIRTSTRQMMLFKDGKSTLDGVNKKSKHQGRGDSQGNIVSYAVDLYPYYKGFDAFNDKNGDKMFYYMAGIIMAIAEKLLEEKRISHRLRWGGNWDDDMDFFQDSNFFDLPHFELVKP